MALSDALDKAERDIASYRNSMGGDWREEIDEILCKMVVLRIDVGTIDDDKLKGNAFFQAALAGDYEKYLQLKQDHHKVDAAKKVGLVETYWLQRLKFFFKLR